MSHEFDSGEKPWNACDSDRGYPECHRRGKRAAEQNDAEPAAAEGRERTQDGHTYSANDSPGGWSQAGGVGDESDESTETEPEKGEQNDHRETSIRLRIERQYRHEQIEEMCAIAEHLGATEI